MSRRFWKPSWNPTARSSTTSQKSNSMPTTSGKCTPSRAPCAGTSRTGLNSRRPLEPFIHNALRNGRHTGTIVAKAKPFQLEEDAMAGKIAIIGVGLVGRAWAITFARAGHPVALWDPDARAKDHALAIVASLLVDLEANGILKAERASAVERRISGAPTMADALAGAIHIQENAPENVDTKRALFAELDSAADSGAVLASSSTAILPSLFTSGVRGRARCLIAHPINPPYLVPAVEI